MSKQKKVNKKTWYVVCFHTTTAPDLFLNTWRRSFPQDLMAEVGMWKCPAKGLCSKLHPTPKPKKKS